MIYIVINGVPMSEKEFKEYKKGKNKELFAKLPKCKQKAILAEKRAEKKKESEMSILKSGIESMLSKVKIIESLSAYYKHAYRQWGTIAREILNEPTIKAPFEKFYLKELEIERCMETIKAERYKEVFDAVEKLSYLIDDAKCIMENLRSAVGSSGVCNRYMLHECINGEGRRLGLRTLMSRTFGAIKEMEKITKEFAMIARNGF